MVNRSLQFFQLRVKQCKEMKTTHAITEVLEHSFYVNFSFRLSTSYLVVSEQLILEVAVTPDNDHLYIPSLMQNNLS